MRSEYKGGYSDVEEEEIEILVIVLSYAVAHPRTMMVHPLDAFPALLAVMHSSQFGIVALLAITVLHETTDFPPKLLKESYILISRVSSSLFLSFLNYFYCAHLLLISSIVYE